MAGDGGKYCSKCHSIDGENWNYIESILDTETNTLSATNEELDGHFTAAGGGGCTDIEAANYDTQAFGDNGTCIREIRK